MIMMYSNFHKVVAGKKSDILRMCLKNGRYYALKNTVIIGIAVLHT